MGDNVPTVEAFAAALSLDRAGGAGSAVAGGDGQAAQSAAATESRDPGSARLAGEGGFVSPRVCASNPGSDSRVKRWRRGFVRWLVEIEDSDALKQLRLDKQRSARRHAQLQERFEAAAAERLRAARGEATIEPLERLGGLYICRWCPECQYSAQVPVPTAGVCRGDRRKPHAPAGIRHTIVWRP